MQIFKGKSRCDFFRVFILAIAMCTFTSVQMRGEECLKPGTVYTLSINLGPVSSVKLGTNRSVTFDSCTKVANVNLGANYWFTSTPSERNHVVITMKDAVLTPSYYGINFTDYSVAGAKTTVYETVFDQAGNKLRARRRTTNNASLSVRLENGSTRVLGGGSARVEEERIDGIYWPPFIAGFWFK